MLTEYTTAELLLAIDAVTFRPTNPFRYESGLLSPMYVDCRRLTSHPEQRALVIDSLTEAFRHTGQSAEIVVATGVSAISLAEAVSRRLGLPMSYVRRSHKGHGLSKQIEGASVERRQVLLISDIISTGADIPSSVRAVRECGGVIAYCQAVFDMQLHDNDRFLSDEQVRYGSLSRLSDLLTVAEITKHLSRRDRQLVDEWHRSPSEWAPRRVEKLNEAIRHNRRVVSEILVRTRAVQIRTDPPFTYSAGGKGPIYTDIRILLAYPDERELILRTLADMVVQEVGIQNIDCLAAVATGGIPYATGLAESLGLPMVVVRTRASDHGFGGVIDGTLIRGARVLVMEDLVNRGQSVLAAAAHLRTAGATVTDCMSILSYGLDATAAAFDQAQLKLSALSDLDVLLTVGVENGVITFDQRATVEAWARHPESWATRSDEPTSPAS
jgi:orotate phosphoribosyltransferase